MRKIWTALIVLIFCGSLFAGEITLKGNTLSNFHTGEKENTVLIYAFDGTPEIKAELDSILKDYFPDKGLDGDGAKKLVEQFDKRLKYYVVLGPKADELWKKVQWGSQIFSLTGEVEEKDGKKWMTVDKYVESKLNFPAKLTEPDKALVKLNGPMLVNISDTIVLKCIKLPAGKFYMGAPYYQYRRWQEDPPHMVTFTKDVYMAEYPVTQEIYEAVMGNNPSKEIDPKMPVHRVDCANMYKFCAELSKRTGLKIRIPTAAEWEYGARSGTSNPTYEEKYKETNSNFDSGYHCKPLPVKSKKSNAWGFYDMHSGWWERVSDGTNKIDTKDTVDPKHIPSQDLGPAEQNTKHGHMGKGQYSYPISEIEFIDSTAGDFRFRIVVE